MNPLPPIHQCVDGDNLRPAMNYALLKKDEIAATDAHILITFASSELFDRELLESLPDEGVLLGKELLQDLAKKDLHSVEYIKDMGLFKVLHVPTRVASFYRYYEVKLQSDQGWMFPNVKAVFPGKDKKQKSIPKIGFNAKILTRLDKAMGTNSGISMEFYGDTHAIVCRPKGSDYTFCKGLIMPVINS